MASIGRSAVQVALINVTSYTGIVPAKLGELWWVPEDIRLSVPQLME